VSGVTEPLRKLWSRCESYESWKKLPEKVTGTQRGGERMRWSVAYWWEGSNGPGQVAVGEPSECYEASRSLRVPPFRRPMALSREY